ncbi:MAG TPA: dihydrolipoamide acetyltransferase family protein [Kiritimatiellia bacterium]|nr:dihydrolipoamide acetyltransferase family protein [Kiritimatiellia bacterium]HMO97998.1 dihydrolipoamide acetyltransferase family protein [Kiritimatiellia bacterium]HMP95349.1 dihydrolipoamide acetyltransferase family protein [Kiritimatiellia bacterium]
MNVPIVMPQMGQSVAEGTIVRWCKKVGETIAPDDVIAEIESDKIGIEVESPVAGILGSCLKREGETASVGEIIGMIIAEGEPEANPGEALPAAEPGQNRPHAGGGGEQILVSAQATGPLAAAKALPDITAAWLSPYVLRLAVQNNISMHELQGIRGSGRQGRITRNDLLQYLARRPVSSNTLSGAAPDPEQVNLAELGQVVPMTSIRRTIADHMVQSIHTSAHVTMVHAVDMTSIVALRDRIKDEFYATHKVKMTYTAVLLFVTARVLREYPIINASVSGTNIIMRKEVNIGCAVALPDESLVVPVVKNADKKSFPEIARDLDRLIRLARDKSLRRQDVEGGTFSLSNFGAFGSLIGTPIINQPQVAILGMGAVFKAPVVIQNQICIRDQIYLSFTFDHRVIDGAMGGRFLNAIQRHTEALTADALNLRVLARDADAGSGAAI